MVGHYSPLLSYTQLTINQNGGYISPPRQKRQHRDPYADWWDKQERRNYGEPLHEDNDILGIFSPEDYTHATPGHGARMWVGSILTVLGLCAVTSYYYPDKPSAPRTWPDGLEAEYGGPGAVSVSCDEHVDVCGGRRG